MRYSFRSGFLIGVSLLLSGCASLHSAQTTPAIPDGALGSELSAMGLTGVAQAEAAKAEYQALQYGAVGQPVAWKSGNAQGEVVPTQLYRVGSQDCRGFTHKVTAGGRTVQQVATACRNGDVWQPVA